MKEIKEAFTKVYKTNGWGSPESIPGRKNKKFYSGGGTDPDNDKDNIYINTLQSYIDREDIKSVIEIGCGDWEVSSRIDWSSVNYTGYDVVEDLIEYNNNNYSKENVRFICNSNIITENNITADLLIVKDVFQHLPPSYYVDFIKSIPTNFKYNLITNDFSNNSNIEFGGYTGNDFSKDPFNMKYEIVIDWEQKFIESGKKTTITITN
jgi:hypothetical protein